MRIIVYPHSMEIGGSQLNAIQLAGAVRDLGHDVIVLSEPGPLVSTVHSLDLEHIEIPIARRRPSVEVAGLLRDLVSHRGIDIVHGHEWPPVIESFLGLAVPRSRCGVVASIMSMSVVPFLPRSIPLFVGTADIRDSARSSGHQSVTLLEPPVDTDTDQPATDGSAFRIEHGLSTSTPLVVTVCRLVPELKGESLLATCDAAEMLHRSGVEVQFVIVGDGPLRSELSAKAAGIEQRTGKRLVVLTGELRDPRPAYAAADIVIGMGGSALRSMAFGKPVVVAGENGFSELLTTGTSGYFLQSGWYGQGPGTRGAGAPALAAAIDELVADPATRAELGAFGRDLVLSRFSLRAAAKTAESVYVDALRNDPGGRVRAADACRTASGLAAYKVTRKIQRFRGRAAVDDANSTPVPTSTSPLLSQAEPEAACQDLVAPRRSPVAEIE